MMNQKKTHCDLQDKADVLIALATHESEPIEQPPRSGELTDFFANSRRFSKQRQDEILAYLDSTPEAYERWIKQGKQAAQSKRMLSFSSMMPYAFATCAALLVVSAFIILRGQTFELDQAIDRTYQTAVSNDNSERFQRTIISLTDSLEQSTQPLSLSQAGQQSQMAQAFMLGLKYDWCASDQKTTGSNHLTEAQQKDYQLGRWHTVLWAITQQNTTMPADFWQKQLNIANHLQAHYAEHSQTTNTTEARAVALQLKRMHSILQQLAENHQITQPYQQLEQTLTALRYSLTLSL